MERKKKKPRHTDQGKTRQLYIEQVQCIAFYLFAAIGFITIAYFAGNAVIDGWLHLMRVFADFMGVFDYA